MLEAKQWNAIVKHLLAHSYRGKTPLRHKFETLARVAFSEGRYTFEATDGYRAIRIRAKAVEGPADTPPPFDVAAQAVALPAKTTGSVTIEPFDKGISIKDMRGEWRVPSVGDPFPPIDRAIHSDHHLSKLSNALANPKYMVAAYSALAELCEGGAELRIGVDPLDPILIVGASEDKAVEVTCIVMPIRA